MINSKLRERKDHFVITIYKENRKNIDASVGDIIIINFNGIELIRPIRKDFHVSIPKKNIDKKNKNFSFEILKIIKKDKGLERPTSAFNENKLDIRYFIPAKTIFDKPIYVIEKDGESSYVWFCIPGGAKHILVKNFVKIEKMGELLGFYFGDGSTSKYIRSFRLTNSEPSTLNYCLNILEDIGISRSLFKSQIIYSTNKKINNKTKNNCIDFWSKKLIIDKSRIVSISKSNSKKESLMYGSMRLFLDNAVLVEIMLNGLLNGVIAILRNPKNKAEKILLVGFLRGLLAAEGSVSLNKNGSVVKIGISFDPHSDELRFYKCILDNLEISYGKSHGNEVIIYNYKNIKKLYDLDVFKIHDKRKEKLTKGRYNHKFFKNAI